MLIRLDNILMPLLTHILDTSLIPFSYWFEICQLYPITARCFIGITDKLTGTTLNK